MKKLNRQAELWILGSENKNEQTQQVVRYIGKVKQWDLFRCFRLLLQENRP